ncbi:TPA: hypothetical protein N0F65_000923 [Lagenidium giganteum]|uniref:Uncharacterized protein n=1 Tax=Lagenidium giganteum TaxID=4803 RepID=A0AAV2YM01_9STRA|nr:TPA: hypothetical protein N0F65_000923 [Lagenidium giganteum]
MVMRGCTLEKATILSANEQAHTALKMSKAEQEEHEREYREALKLSEAKKQANADYKLQLKNSKHQQLVEEAQLIIQRLELWYSNERLSNEDNNVDVTESNTILSPSRTLAFIDQHGNLRRKSVEKPNQDFDSLSDVATSPTSSAASTPSPNMMMATPPPPPPRQTKQ